MAHIVAVQHVSVPPQSAQSLLDDIGDGGFAGPRKASEPEHRRPLSLDRRPQALVRGHRLPMDVGGAAQTEIDHASAGSRIGKAIDDDEPTSIAVFHVWI